MDEKALISVGSLLLGGIIKLGLEWIKRKQFKSESFSSFGKLHHEAEIFLRTTKVDRLWIFKLTKGKSKRIFLLLEITKINSAYNLLQDYEVDAEFFNLIKKLKTEKIIDWRSEDIQTSTLKRFYHSENIKTVRLFYIHETRKFIYYGSYSSKSLLNSKNSVISVKFHVLLNIIKNTFIKNAP